jgi:polar amino acid transport system substrate-binding protein
MNLAELIRYLGSIAEDFEHDSSSALEDLRDISVLIDGRIPYYDGHLLRVRDYTGIIARAIGLSEHELVSAEVASLLHDVGKLAIDYRILLKDSVLNPIEHSIVLKHSVIGYYMLQGFSGFNDALLGIKHHHERFDGTGYPSGYAGQKIPLISRIITVADAYDAMTSERPYRYIMDRDRAQLELKKNSGSQFDPIIVDAFLRS